MGKGKFGEVIEKIGALRRKFIVIFQKNEACRGWLFFFIFIIMNLSGHAVVWDSGLHDTGHE